MRNLKNSKYSNNWKQSSVRILLSCSSTNASSSEETVIPTAVSTALPDSTRKPSQLNEIAGVIFCFFASACIDHHNLVDYS